MNIQNTFLIEFLRTEIGHISGSEADPETLFKELTAGKIWENIEYVAEEHLIAPIIYKQLKLHSIQTPKNTARAFAALSVRHHLAHRARIKALAEILQLFGQRNIGVVILKGAALAHLVYAKPELRPMRDIDLLVKKPHLNKAANTLLELGFVFDEEHINEFMGVHHHLPNAAKQVDSMKISVEIHHDAIVTDVCDSITIDNLTENPRSFMITDNVEAKSLNHIDMLRHLCRHSFEPASEIKLIHMYDMVAYTAKFYDEIDWGRIKSDFPGVVAALQCAHFVLPLAQSVSAEIGIPFRVPSNVLKGMKPLSAIFKKRRDYGRALRELFAPPEWWMYGYYGVNPDNSLLACRLIIHPFNVAKWLIKRARNSLGTRIGTS